MEKKSPDRRDLSKFRGIPIQCMVNIETYRVLQRMKADGVSYGETIDAAVKFAEDNGKTV